jgi:hypothetical protein
MMLQKTLTCFFENPGPNPFLINPNDTMEELHINKFSSSYLCLVVFRGAMDQEEIGDESLHDTQDEDQDTQDEDEDPRNCANASHHPTKTRILRCSPSLPTEYCNVFPLPSSGHCDVFVVSSPTPKML